MFYPVFLGVLHFSHTSQSKQSYVLKILHLVQKYAILSHTAFFFFFYSPQEAQHTHTYTHFSLIRCLASTAWVCNNGLWLTSPCWLCGTSWGRGKDFQYKEFTTFHNSLVSLHPTLTQAGTWTSFFFPQCLWPLNKSTLSKLRRNAIKNDQLFMRVHSSHAHTMTGPIQTDWTGDCTVYIDKFLFSPLSHMRDI